MRRRHESISGAGNPFTPEELDRILQAAKESGSMYFYPFICLLADTGCRKGEALGLKWSDVDFAARTVTFRDTKNKRNHTMPLTDRALDALQECGRIRVIGDDRVIRFTAPWHDWRRCLERAAVPRRRVQDLRHSFGHRLAESGLSAVQIAMMMNHATLQMARRYSGDASLELKRKALEAIR